MADASQPRPATVQKGSAQKGSFHRGEWRFVTGAVAIDGLPPADLPEIAFAGRSNVGKSSLINALAGERQLARVSNTPGRTQQVNFFTVGERLRIVDLPGYGYAEAPKKLVEGWTELIRLYLKGRVNLRLVLLLIDGRHGIKPNDLEILKLLDAAAVSTQIVLTKADKIGANALAETLAKAQAQLKRHPAARPDVLPTSAETGDGIEALAAIMQGAVSDG